MRVPPWEGEEAERGVVNGLAVAVAMVVGVAMVALPARRESGCRRHYGSYQRAVCNAGSAPAAEAATIWLPASAAAAEAE